MRGVAPAGLRAARARAGRARRVLLVLLALLLLLVALAPLLARPLVKGKVLAALETSLDARAALDELSFGWSGRLHLAGLTLETRDGRPIARAARLDARVAPLAALRGRYEVELDLEGCELHVWKRADGSWNVVPPPPPGEAPPAGGGGGGAPPERPTALPDVRARALVKDAALIAHGAQGETTVALDLSLDLRRWEEPAPFELRARVRGPAREGGEGGALRASGSFALAERGARGARGASGSLELVLDGLDGAALAPALSLAAPLERVEGRLDGTVALALAPELALSGTLELTLAGALVQPAGAASVRVPDATLRGEASAEASGAGRQVLALALGPALDARWEGTLADAAGGGRALDGRLTARAALEALQELSGAVPALAAAPALAGALEADALLRAELAPDTTPRTLEVRADVTAERLAARDEAGAALPLEALAGARVHLDAAFEQASQRLELRALRTSAHAFELEGSAVVARVGADPAAARVERSLWNASADLGLLQKDLARLLPEAAGQVAGRLTARLEASGAPSEALRARGEAALESLALAWPVAGDVLRLEDPRLAIGLDLALAPEARRGTGTVEIASRVLTGSLEGGLALAPGETGEVTFENVRGAFTYVPDRLAEVVGPWLPGKLSGAAPQRLDVRIDGPAAGFAPEALLARTTASAEVEVGRLELDGLTLEGRLGLQAEGGRSILASALRANGGSLELEGGLGLVAGASEPPHLRVSAKDVEANSRLAPLLGRLHPAFASLEAVQGNALSGLIETELTLRHEAPLTLSALAQGGMQELARGLDGEGRFGLSRAGLRGSSLLSDLLGQLGLDAGRSLDLQPLRFVIEKGRVSYSEPWRWTIDGVGTTFEGSIGLDRTLQMAWRVPITERLVDKHAFLSGLRGQMLELPVTGTLTRPRLEVSGLLSQLAAQAARSEIEKRLGGGGGADDPTELLRRADEMWKAGEKVEAAALYRRLHEDHRLSLVYALNRDRIKDRADYEPPR